MFLKYVEGHCKTCSIVSRFSIVAKTFLFIIFYKYSNILDTKNYGFGF